MEVDPDFVLEFVVDHISCLNTTLASSPLVVTIPGCPAFTLNAKSATINKLTYRRGKRITVNGSQLLNLRILFVLVHSHGDHSVRASCEVDFLKWFDRPDDHIPMVYDLEIGMDRPMGERFGVMSLTCQAIRVDAFRQMLAMPNLTHIPDSGRRISVIRKPPATPERHVRRSELWIGNHSPPRAASDIVGDTSPSSSAQLSPRISTT
jgi:hypothetical protein